MAEEARPDLGDLSFAERWARVGARPAAQSQPCATLGGHKPYLRMTGSFKLRTPGELSHSAPRATPSAVEFDASSVSMKRAPRPHEPGSSLRFCTSSVAPEPIPRPDCISLVAGGLQSSQRQAADRASRNRSRVTRGCPLLLADMAGEVPSASLESPSSRSTPLARSGRSSPMSMTRSRSAPLRPASEGPGEEQLRLATAARHKIGMELLWSTEPAIAQLMEYFFSAFRTLRMAFNHMDMNGNGLLSKAEFKDSLKAMRSRDGSRPIEHHLDCMFQAVLKDKEENDGHVLAHKKPRENKDGPATLADQLDSLEMQDRTMRLSAVSFDQLLDALDCGEPLLQRIAKFVVEEVKNSGLQGSPPPPTTAPRRDRMEWLLPWSHDMVVRQGGISQIDFVTTFIRLRYNEWHANDLFDRLDRDHSGQISFNEFAVMLEREREPQNALAPKRQEPIKVLVPLGSEARRRELEGGHTLLANSTKLRGGMLKSASTNTIPCTDHCKGADWVKALAVCYERPNQLHRIQDGITRRGHSELHRQGHHILSGNPERAPDLCQSLLGLHQFDSSASRTRVDMV